MTVAAWIHVIIGVIGTVFVCYGIIHENKFVAFEEKLWQRIKSKLKALKNKSL